MASKSPLLRVALATAAVIVLGAGLVPEPFVRLANFTIHSQFVPFLR